MGTRYARTRTLTLLISLIEAERVEPESAGNGGTTQEESYK